MADFGWILHGYFDGIRKHKKKDTPKINISKAKSDFLTQKISFRIQNNENKMEFLGIISKIPHP